MEPIYVPPGESELRKLAGHRRPLPMAGGQSTHGFRDASRCTKIGPSTGRHGKNSQTPVQFAFEDVARKISDGQVSI
jgi:hypothetical protein